MALRRRGKRAQELAVRTSCSLVFTCMPMAACFFACTGERRSLHVATTSARVDEPSLRRDTVASPSLPCVSVSLASPCPCARGAGVASQTPLRKGRRLCMLLVCHKKRSLAGNRSPSCKTSQLQLTYFHGSPRQFVVPGQRVFASCCVPGMFRSLRGARADLGTRHVTAWGWELLVGKSHPQR